VWVERVDLAWEVFAAHTYSLPVLPVLPVLRTRKAQVQKPELFPKSIVPAALSLPMTAASVI